VAKKKQKRTDRVHKTFFIVLGKEKLVCCAHKTTVASAGLVRKEWDHEFIASAIIQATENIKLHHMFIDLSKPIREMTV
jgi:hypothetical protein